MDLRQMRYVKAIAEIGNMTRAAEHLHISQSTLSLSYRKLEQELGVSLFRQKGRCLELTDAGSLFCQKAQKILEQNDDLLLAMEQFSGKTRTKISFFTDAVDYSEEASLLYKSFFPEIQIMQNRIESINAYEAFIDQQTDFLIMMTPPTNPSFSAQLLLDEPMFALVCKNSALANKEFLSLQDLCQFPLITQRDGFAITDLTCGFFTQAGLIHMRVDPVNDPEMITLKVGKGVGISFIPESLCFFEKNAALLEAAGCTARPLLEKHCRRQIYLVTERRKRFLALPSAFMDYLIDFGIYTQEHRSFPDKTVFAIADGYQLSLLG